MPSPDAHVVAPAADTAAAHGSGRGRSPHRQALHGSPPSHSAPHRRSRGGGRHSQPGGLHRLGKVAERASAPARGDRRLHFPGGHEPAAQSTPQRCPSVRIDASTRKCSASLPADAAEIAGWKRRSRCASSACCRSCPRARDREILVRFYLQEEEKDAICRDLALEADQFDKVLHRARARLKELLESHGLRKSDFFMLCL